MRQSDDGSSRGLCLILALPCAAVAYQDHVWWLWLVAAYFMIGVVAP